MINLASDDMVYEDNTVNNKGNKFSGKEIFKNYRYKILTTYFLSIFENSFALLFPYTTGLAINDIMVGKTLGLVYLASAWLINGLTHMVRQRYNIRVFSLIYRDVACNVVREQTDRGVENSKIVARSSLSREFVDFFERNIPMLLNTLFRSLGALVMLFIYDWHIAAYCIALAVPLYLINKKYAKKSLVLNKKLNDQYEKEVGILTKNIPENIYEHYTLLSKGRVNLIDTQVINWGIMELFIICLIIAVIVRAGTLAGAAAGTIYSIVSYTWNFVNSLDQVPALVQQISRLKDIKSRMEQL